MVDVVMALSTATTLATQLLGVAEKVKHAELRNLAADLKIQLAGLKEQFAAQQEENVRLKSEVTQLKSQQDVKAQLEIRDGLYFWPNPPKGKSEGPYCTRCADADNTTILLTELGPVFHIHIGRFKCPQCETTYR